MEKLNFHWVEDTFTFINKKKVPQRIEKNAEFYFIESPEKINNKNDAYFVVIKEECLSKEDLMNEYCTKFKFPYFGSNWDALLDSLRDLDWIEQKDIIIYHKVLPKLNKKDLEIYLDILRYAIGDWKKWNEHNFEVYFNLKDYDRVQPHVRRSVLAPSG